MIKIESNSCKSSLDRPSQANYLPHVGSQYTKSHYNPYKDALSSNEYDQVWTKDEHILGIHGKYVKKSNTYMGRYHINKLFIWSTMLLLGFILHTLNIVCVERAAKGN